MRCGDFFWRIERFDDVIGQGIHARGLVQTDLAMLAMAVNLLAGNILAGKLMACLSVSAVILGGLLIGVAGLLATSVTLTGYMHLWVVSMTMVVYGGDTALAIAPMTSTILSTAPGELVGMAPSLPSAVRQTGSLLDVTAVGAVAMVMLGLTHVAPMAFGLMVLSYAGATAMA